MSITIAVLPGDGVGPEVTDEAVKALRGVVVADFEFAPIGGAAIDATGDPLPPDTLALCKRADAVLLGAVGGPKWSDPAAEVRPEQGLLRLRRELGVFANLRPVKVLDPSASPLRPELAEGVDLLFVRELTGGIYFGEPREEARGEPRHAFDTMIYSEPEVRRVAEVAFGLAKARRAHVTSVDKANVLASSRLWRQVVDDVGAAHPDVALHHQLVDSMAMRLVTSPRDFDVVLAPNLFGDILSDEGAVLTGTLGLLPSASVGAEGPGLFEPVHGSAPDIAGRGHANPVAAILSAALLCRHGLGDERAAGELEWAVREVLASGVRTPDLGGSASTCEVGTAVRSLIT